MISQNKLPANAPDISVTRDELESLLLQASDALYQHDGYLICHEPAFPSGQDAHCGERPIVFRFGHYLQNLLEKHPILRAFDLDCEYNRNGYDLKRLPHFGNGTYPDLILHRRGDNDANLLIAEFKTWWKPDTAQDILKIEEFLDKRGAYHYKFGISILLQKQGSVFQWIKA